MAARDNHRAHTQWGRSERPSVHTAPTRQGLGALAAAQVDAGDDDDHGGDADAAHDEQGVVAGLSESVGVRLVGLVDRGVAGASPGPGLSPSSGVSGVSGVAGASGVSGSSGPGPGSGSSSSCSVIGAARPDLDGRVVAPRPTLILGRRIVTKGDLDSCRSGIPTVSGRITNLDGYLISSAVFSRSYPYRSSNHHRPQAP